MSEKRCLTCNKRLVGNEKLLCRDCIGKAKAVGFEVISSAIIVFGVVKMKSKK